MNRRKIFVLAGLLFVAIPLMANVCIEILQSTPECTEGCITAAQMATLLNVPLATTQACFDDHIMQGRVEFCTPGGGGTGYCRI
jgi:hypothetical protein